MLINSCSFRIPRRPPPAFLFNGNFQFARSLFGNAPKQRAKPNICMSQCDKEHAGSTLFFFSKCATTVFFLLSHIAAYSCLTCGSLLFSRVQSAPHFTSCSYLSIFICLALEEWGGGVCLY